MVVVVDAETVRARAVDKYVGDTVLSQIKSGHIILVNKLDLLDEGDAEQVTAWVAGHNPEALIVSTVNSAVAPELLFGQSPAAVRSSEQAGTDDHDHHHGHQHDEVFESWTWRSVTPLPRSRVEAVMDALPQEVMRVKGLMLIEERADKLMLLQRVGQRWTLVPHSPIDEASQSQLVFIGLAGAIDDQWIADQLG